MLEYTNKQLSFLTMGNNFEENLRVGPSSGPNRILSGPEKELAKLRAQNERLKNVARTSGTKKRELRELSETDELTGVFNKRGLEKRLYALFSQLTVGESEKRKEAISKIALAVVDMDGLKGINDNLGHPIGDQALISLARHLKSKLRSTDILGRCGEKSDEFIIVMVNMTEERLENRLLELEQSLEGVNIADNDGHPVPVRASLGFLVIDKNNVGDMSIEEAKKLADQRMYANKMKRKTNPDGN